MSRKPMLSSRSLAVLFLCLLALPRLTAGPVFKPGTKLSVIRTEHFDIIFPAISKASALHLSSIAEAVYTEVAGRLHIDKYGPIPVVITPDIGSFNGYTNQFPYPHIVLYDTPTSPDWCVFDDNFRSLFLHELTHAVSLRSRAPWLQFLGGIFGSWVLPAIINSPQFMVEGIAVNFESADGLTGRANDPLVKERLRQDIYENRFMSPADASGLYADYPSGRIYYEYGGLFNLYINKKYGPEAYARLWHSMGDLWPLGFPEIFQKVYGISLEKAWADFRYSLDMPGIVDPPVPLAPLDGYGSFSGGLAANYSFVFWVDAARQRAFALDAASAVLMADSADGTGTVPARSTAKIYSLFDADSTSAISDASPDADPAAAHGRLLVSRALPSSDGRDRLETAVYDLEAGAFVRGAVYKDLREARFSGNGIIGISSNLHNTDLVSIEDGERHLLLRGSENLMFASPCVLSSSKIALIAVINGERHLALYDRKQNSLEFFEPAGLSALPGAAVPEAQASAAAPDAAAADSNPFRSIRGLSAANGRLYFSCGSNNSFYRLGCVDGMCFSIDTVDYSGGVLFPVEAGGAIFYAGRFSRGSRLCMHPVRPAEFSSDSATLSHITLRAGSTSMLGSPGTALSAGDDSASRASENAPVTAAVLPYNPLRYMNPFNEWIFYCNPSETIGGLPVLRSDFNFCDPFDTVSSLVKLMYYPRFPAYAGLSLKISDSTLPVKLSSTLADSLGSLSEGADTTICRGSSAAIEADLSLPFYPQSRAAVFELGAQALAIAPLADGSSSPYEWPYMDFDLTCSALAGYQGRLAGLHGSSRGIGIYSYSDYNFSTITYKTENQFILAFDQPWLRFDLWACWASGQILKMDSSDSVFSGGRRPAADDFILLLSDSYDGIALLTGRTRLSDLPINKDILGIYIGHAMFDAGLKSAAVFQTQEFSWSAAASCFADMDLQLSIALGSLILNTDFYAETFLAIAGADRPVLQLGYTFGFKLSNSARIDKAIEPVPELYQ